MKGERVLVTGAAGILGGEVVSLLKASGIAVTALVHRKHQLFRNDGSPILTADSTGHGAGTVICLSGDIAASDLGLSKQLRQELQASTRLIVHLAAITEFGHPASMYETANWQGTANVVEFAMSAKCGPIPLVHVSTAYVCGSRGGLVTESDLESGQEFSNDYERSKYKAELVVKEAMSRNLPAVIVRPSIVVGHQQNGVIREFGNIYAILRALTEGRVRAIPGVYGALLDLVPLDYVASVIFQAATRFTDLQGQTLHAVSGQPLTLRIVSDVLAEYPAFYVPRFIPPENFKVEGMGRRERWIYERLVQLYVPYFQHRTEFSNDATLAVLPRRKQLPAPVMLRNLLNYATKVGYLGRALEVSQEEGVLQDDS